MIQQHASPEHIHLTTRRCFIGPIPEGWLKSHRKSWYKRYLNLSDYSSRTATFSAGPGISHQRSITGLDSLSATAKFGGSFPQPADTVETYEDDSDDAEEQGDGDSLEDHEGEGEMNQLEAQSTSVEAKNDTPEQAIVEIESPDRKAKRPPTFKNRLISQESKDRVSTSSFVTAPTRPRKRFKSRLEPITHTRRSRSSFVTAAEAPIEGTTDPEEPPLDPGKKSPRAQVKRFDSPPTPKSGTQPRSSGGDMTNQGDTVDSTTNLLGRDRVEDENLRSNIVPAQEAPIDDGAAQPVQATSHGMVKFNIEDNHDHRDGEDAARIGQDGRRRIWRRLRQGSSHPGEIVKIEKMLVRIDSTVQDLPSDYNENDSLKTESRTVEKWREFVVVCRESTTENADFSVQMYKTRVIPSKENTHVKKRSTHEIPLDRKSTRVNLYSSLDKTLVIWVPWKRGTMMYILRTHSVASAVEWYTFIRQSLGSHRTKTLQVNVPDLSVSLQLENPFEELETSMTATQVARSVDTMANRTTDVERAVASTIIQRSLKMLENNAEWADVLQSWLSEGKIGLAWKRYDRLEWVHGANEQRMYGTIGMQQTHELELRPKDHYPTNVKNNCEAMDEPAPVEGFLIRLTSQKGHVRRLGKMYFKRLYFTTHNQFLCYCRPAKALPPPPPKLSLMGDTKIPSASEIVDNTPLIYAVNPFPYKNGYIEWLRQGSPASEKRHDEDAYKEAERKINGVLQAEGYINLSHVVRVQDAQRGNSPADANVDQGPDVDFHEEAEDTRTDDGKTNQFDDDRTFELVMKNKLVIRLQAYNEITKKEWMARLRKLVSYWRLRLTNDMDMLKAIRRLNLERLEIDEESEAYIGQFGSKWEVTRSVASPKLFNMCGIACCRAITVCALSPASKIKLTLVIDVRNPVSQAQTPFHLPTLRRHPLPWPVADLPRHAPGNERERSPSHSARATSVHRPH